MSKESEHKIYSAAECLSEKMMFDYIDHRLSPKERHLVEKHMLDCELCSDALEGLQLVKDRTKIGTINKTIDARITPEKETKTISINFKTVFSIAATIALLVAGVFFFNQFADKNMKESNMAELKEEDMSPPPPVTSSGEAIGGVKETVPTTDEPKIKEKKALLESATVSDEEIAFAEEPKPAYWYKNDNENGDVTKQPGTGAGVTNGLAEQDQTIVQADDQIATLSQAPAESANAPQENTEKSLEKERILNFEGKKAEEQTATGNTYSTATNTNTTSTPDLNQSQKNNVATDSKVTLAKKADKGEKYRSETATGKDKAKSSAGKETRADSDLEIAGTVAYEPQSITEEKEELKAQVNTKTVTDSIYGGYVYTVAETMPEFIGGKDSLFKFIHRNLKFSSTIKDETETQSTKIFVQFIVGKDGAVRDAKIVKGISPSLDKEALRVVNMMPKWKPGTQKGKAVSVLYNLPIQLEIK